MCFPNIAAVVSSEQIITLKRAGTLRCRCLAAGRLRLQFCPPQAFFILIKKAVKYSHQYRRHRAVPTALGRGTTDKLLRKQMMINMKKTTNDLRTGLLARAWLMALLLCSAAPLLAQNVRGGSVGDPTSLLDLQSTSKGLLLPRMSSAERSAIANPAEGLLIYNTNLGCIEINIGDSANPNWGCILAMSGRIEALNCGAAVLYDGLIVGAASGVQVAVPYTGGNGSFYQGQVVSSTGVTGLTASILSGAFAKGSGSLIYTITGSPTSRGTASFALSIGGQTCTLNLPVTGCGAFVASGVWKEFMCHNLGANTSANPLTPSWELVGNYYQWGRNPSCFGRDVIAAPNPCSSLVYGVAGPWGSTAANDNAGSITGWNTTDAFNGAWQDGVKTVNDPCPAGFRVPTRVQWDGVSNSSLNTRTFIGTWTDGSTNYSSGIRFGESLFIPASGLRDYINGALSFRGTSGRCWSSTEETSTRAWRLGFGNGFASTEHHFRTYGYPVRCIAE